MNIGKMPVWIYLVGAVIAAGILLLYIHQRRVRRMLSGLPSYPHIPVIGNIMMVAGGGRGWFKMLEDISRVSEREQKPFLFWGGPIPVLFTHDPDDVKLITNTLIEKPYYYNFAKPWLGDGLVTAPGHIWKHNIKKLAGIFTNSVVEEYQSVFNSQAEKLVQALRGKAGKPPFDVMSNLAYATLETICQTAFGIPRISETIVTDKYYQAFNRCLQLLISRGMNLLVHLDFLYNLTPSRKELQKTVAVLHSASHTVIRKSIQLREDKKKYQKIEDYNDEKPHKFKTVIEILTELAESDPMFTETQIKHEVNTILLGGQETVATGMFYALLTLGSKKNIQEKLYQEIKSVFGDSKRPVTKDDITRIPYCEAVVCEVLRLYPPFPAVIRYADKDLQLKSCTIPQGTACLINIWGAGHSQRLWGEDADTFNPERWFDKGVPTPTSFITFSYGRRACIGKKYAINLMKTLLIYLVREFEFTSEAEKLELKVDITLRADAGHLLEIAVRDN